MQKWRFGVTSTKPKSWERLVYSSKKPYISYVDSRGYGKSVADFYSTPTYHMKEVRGRFSDFEKPYVDDNYPFMQLPTWRIPWPDWVIPPFVNPNMPNVPPPSQWDPAPEKMPQPILGCHWVEDLPYELSPGENYNLAVWANAFSPSAGGSFFGEPIVEVRPDGEASVSMSPIPGFFLGGHAFIHPNAPHNEHITIAAITASGQSCQAAGVVVACLDTATIGYTTTQMDVDEEQTLTIEDGEGTYVWEITAGSGTLSDTSGTPITYTAPSSNAECDENATITLSCGGEVIDTLQIAINEYTGDEEAYRQGFGSYIVNQYQCRNIAAGQDCSGTPDQCMEARCLNIRKYKCDKTMITAGTYKYCQACYRKKDNTPPPDCDIPEKWSKQGFGWDFDTLEECWADLPFWTETYADDKRTEAMITGGCCPDVLL
jgi:hypothetical protein